MNNLNIEIVKNMMDKSYTLTYVDYSESLDGDLEIIESCIESQNSDNLYEHIGMAYDERESESIDDIKSELKVNLINMGYCKNYIDDFFESNDTKISELIFDKDDSHPIKELIKNTRDIPVRIELLSNYDCINSHFYESQGGYSYYESYFGDMVDALNLNPTKVKKLLVSNGEKPIGIFPSKAYRNGQELVSYEEFYEELVNSCCGANLLVFTGMLSVNDLFQENFVTKKILIPKGNYCGLFSPFQGGGSILDMSLKDDLIIWPYKNRKKYGGYRIELDYRKANYGYSIAETYGMDRSFFKNKIKIMN